MNINLNKNNINLSVASIHMSKHDHEMSYLSADEVERQLKRKLMNLLVEELYKNNHIEFTKIDSDLDLNTTIVRARIVSVDKDVIRELRNNFII